MKTGGLFEKELKRWTTDCQRLGEEEVRLQRHLLATMAIWEMLSERTSKAVAREMHDDLGQVLTALRMDISLFILQHQADDALLAQANGMLALTDRCMQSVSGLINFLRLPNFDQGLVFALERLCHDFRQRYKLPCVLTISSDCNVLDRERSIVLFRILNEALANIAMHAAPNTVSIALHMATETGLHLEINDDGCGFDLSKACSGNCLGLKLMYESAFALGGQIEIISEKNIGTTVKVQIPRGSPFAQGVQV